MEKTEREDYSQYIDSMKNTNTSSAGLGNLGEILKAKMAEKKISGH